MLESIKCWEQFFPNIVIREFSKEKLIDADVVADFNSILNAFFDIEISLESIKFN